MFQGSCFVQQRKFSLALMRKIDVDFRRWFRPWFGREFEKGTMLLKIIIDLVSHDLTTTSFKTHVNLPQTADSPGSTSLFHTWYIHHPVRSRPLLLTFPDLSFPGKILAYVKDELSNIQKDLQNPWFKSKKKFIIAQEWNRGFLPTK